MPVDGHHRVEVRDRGRGIPDDKRERVFAPLARLDKTVEGSGIGLATCRRIVEAHGGRMGVEDREGGGSVFWFELPAPTPEPAGAVAPGSGQLGLLHLPRGVDVADDGAVEPGGEPLRPRGSRAARPAGSTSSSRERRTTPSSSCTQQPDDAAVPPGRGAGVAVGVEEVGDVVRGRGRRRATSSPSRWGRASAAAPPTARRAGVLVVSSGSTQPVVPSSSVDLDGAEVGQRPGDGGLGRAQPPLDVGRGAGAERGQPAAHERGVAGGLVERLVHDAEPVLGGRPGRLVEPPVPGVAPAERPALEARGG